jgi:hypothetical protein
MVIQFAIEQLLLKFRQRSGTLTHKDAAVDESLSGIYANGNCSAIGAIGHTTLTLGYRSRIGRTGPNEDNLFVRNED